MVPNVGAVPVSAALLSRMSVMSVAVPSDSD